MNLDLDLERWSGEYAPPPADVQRLLQAARSERPSESSVDRAFDMARVAAVAGGLGVSATLPHWYGRLLRPLLRWSAVGVASAALVAIIQAGYPRWVSVDTPATPARLTHVVGRRVPILRSRGVWASAPSTETREAPSASKLVGGLSVGAMASAATASPATHPHVHRGAMAASPPLASNPHHFASPLPTGTPRVHLLNQARRAIVDGRSATALALVDEYERTRAPASLGREGLHIRYDALIALGRTQQAERVRQRLLRDFPRSRQARAVSARQRSSSQSLVAGRAARNEPQSP